MNAVWTGMIVVGILFALPQGEEGARQVTRGILSGAENAVTFAFGLIGVLAFWSGMLKLAEKAGITALIARALTPVVRRIFPSVPPRDPASASIVMALAANLLGLGNAATPLGIRAMKDLARLNRGSPRASDAMCTFLALSTSSITLIPGSVIAIRAATGSADPAAIVGTTLVATTVSTVVALVLDRMLRSTGRGRRGDTR